MFGRLMPSAVGILDIGEQFKLRWNIGQQGLEIK